MSETAQSSRCFQCGAGIDRDPLVAELAGENRAFCCDGCLRAAHNIHDLDLHDYYRYREKFGDIDRVDIAPGSKAFHEVAEDERRLALSSSMRPVKGGQRISVRVPDIRCAACTWLIESSLRKRPEVTGCRTNLADRVVTIDFSGADPLDVVEFIEGLGFTVLPDRSAPARERLAAERKALLARLGVAGIGMMQVMMFALATYVAGEGSIEPAYEALMRWASLIVATPIAFYSAMPFHQGAIRDLKNLSPGMDVPVSLAILAAYILSLINTVGQAGEVYYDSVSMFTFLLLIGRFVELGSRQRYQQSQILSDSLLPASARRMDGVRIPIADVAVGDLVKVTQGESIPVDGIIVDGNTSVAEAAFTGESTPVEKREGARVLAGSDNLEGEITVRATARYQDFVITRISDLFRESTSYKPRFSVAADVVARYFVTCVLFIAATSASYWYLAGLDTWFSVGLAVLVVSCPCALSLATPVAYTVAVSAMRNNGVVIGNGVFLERLTRITQIVFDKTGTITRGQLNITNVVLVGDVSEVEARTVAAALEQFSRHPIARAFEMPVTRSAVDVEVVPGQGVAGFVDGRFFRLGKPEFVSDAAPPHPDGAGTWVLLAHAEPLAWFCLADEARPEAATVVAGLRKDFDVALFTGDVIDEAARLGKLVGIEEIVARLTPEEKLERIRQLQDSGEHVLMIGDGVNDAAAMGAADTSLAVSPVDIVVQEAADATLIHEHLDRVPMVIAYAHRARRIIRQNIAWAVCYNAFVIPLAVTGFIVPWMAALGMSLSSILVVLNANRLHYLRPTRQA